MTSYAITTRFNESKHQMTVQTTGNSVPIDNITGTRFGFMSKDLIGLPSQVAIKSFFYRVIQHIRDENILNEIQAGDHGPTGSLLISIQIDTGQIRKLVRTTPDWWIGVFTNTIVVAIPLEAGWSRDDASTLYLDSVAKRTFEKMRETFLIKA